MRPHLSHNPVLFRQCFLSLLRLRSFSSNFRRTILNPSSPSPSLATAVAQCSPYRPLSTSSRQDPLRVAVIGSGPAGFYTAYRILKNLPTAKVDMYEALPVPYGLVRFGVAPDHPEVKNCQDRFDEVAQSPSFRYLGNLPIGEDIPFSPRTSFADTNTRPTPSHHLPLTSIVPHYHALILSYGASKERKLNIPGESTLRNIYSARAFVGWYNGAPEHRHLNPDLENAEEAVIIGHGNVALDVARMLLTGVDRLKKTDVTEYALNTLSKSRIRNIRIVGRRGPMQASFTLKELRELLNLPPPPPTQFQPIHPRLLPPENAHAVFDRPQQRLIDLLEKYSLPYHIPELPPPYRFWSLEYLLSPLSFLSTPTNLEVLSAVQFRPTKLIPPSDGSLLGDDLAIYDPKARVEIDRDFDPVTFDAQIAFTSIGYQSIPLPGAIKLGIPFNPKLGLIPNESGRVVIPQQRKPFERGSEAEMFGGLGVPEDTAQSVRVPGVYVAGWVKRGPTGVIASTMFDAFETADAVVEDWENPSAGFMEFLDVKGWMGGGREVVEGKGRRDGREKRGWEAVEEEVKRRGLRVVTWKDWKKIEDAERRRGMRLGGKEKEKFASVEEMLKVLD